MPRGGKRVGAGRPKGTGKYGEITTPMRIPNTLVDDVVWFVESKGFSIPFYSGKVAAGAPALTDDHSDGHVNLFNQIIKSSKDTFMVRASGESMIGVGIHPDDYLVVDRSAPVSNGCIVVAAVNGELTVKTYWKEASGQVTLIAENSVYENIPIDEFTSFNIWGVVKNVIKTF